MVRGIAGWTAELERSFKELLFRFLEEVQSTKAALYLFGREGTYRLAVQYGFGRQDLIAIEHHASDPLARKVREVPTRPQVFNRPEDFAEATSYLQGAGTSRLMLVPLHAGSRVVGFVDLRDKGRKRAFEEGDLERAAAIAEAIVRLIRQAALYPDVEEEELSEPKATVSTKAAASPTPEEAPKSAIALIDEQSTTILVDTASDLPQLPGLAAVAMSVINQDTAGTIIFAGKTVAKPDKEALLHHQLEALRLAGVATPELTSWEVELRQVDGGGEIVGPLHVSSSVLLLAPAWSLLGSVLAMAGSGAARTALNRLHRDASREAEATSMRRARRFLARRLIQRGENGYPELVKHSLAVSRLCWSVAASLGGSPADMEEAALAGLLHDIGMYHLDYRTVYRHPSPGLEERRLYQQHVVAGAAAASEVGLAKVVQAVRHHHERWDGQGYPDRLARDAIPPLARLVHAAEVFDVLTADHSYRQPVTPAKAVSIIRAAAGQQFDPDVVEALIGVVG